MQAIPPVRNPRRPPGAGCSGSGSACYGSSTASSKFSRRCRSGCLLRSWFLLRPLAWVGQGRGELGSERLDISPGHCGRVCRLDPDRHRRLAARRDARCMVETWRAGQPGLGADRLGVRRGIRRRLRPGSDLAVRYAGSGALLLHGGRPYRVAAARLGHAASGPLRPRRLGPVLLLHGGAASVARSRVLAAPVAGSLAASPA